MLYLLVWYVRQPDNAEDASILLRWRLHDRWPRQTERSNAEYAIHERRRWIVVDQEQNRIARIFRYVHSKELINLVTNNYIQLTWSELLARVNNGVCGSLIDIK